MNRSTWEAISTDPGIWKKLGLGVCLQSIVVTLPLSLGIIGSDLEAEVQRKNSKDPSSENFSLPSLEGFGKLITNGIGPSIVLAAILAMFAIVSIPSGLSYFQLVAYFHAVDPQMPELHTEMKVSIITKLISILIGLFGLACQLTIAATLPIALAQYGRGLDLGPSVSPLENIYTVFNLGAQYWKKSLGTTLGLLALTAYIVTSGFSLEGVLAVVVWLLINAALFISLILSSRMALDYLIGTSEPDED